MVSSLVIGINVFGSIVSLFSVYVTYSLYRKYRLQTSLFFVVTALAILLWNFLHLALNFISEDASSGLVRTVWLMVVISGIIFVYAFIFGYSMLRYEYINWRLIIYASLATAFILMFIFQDDWVTVAFNPDEGWVTHVENQTFWSLFAISIFIADFIEIIIPLVNTYSRTTKNKNVLMVMLVGILLAIFSNALEPILSGLQLPQAIRFLIADFGFLIFFIILLKYPFTGLYDNSILDRVIIAGTDGVPKVMLAEDTSKAILASGALISINSILEEMTSTVELVGDNGESKRKIELGVHQFYIIIRKSNMIVFQFRNPSGVCFAKFKSLGRIFEMRHQEKREEELLQEFQTRVAEYFTDFTPTQISEDEITS